MKGTLLALTFGIILLVISYFKLAVYRSENSIDIHLHDTYFVLDYTALVLIALFVLGNFFSIGGLIGTHFKSKLFWALMIFFLAIDTYCVISIYKMFKETELLISTDNEPQ